jgi:hypothetical protein
MKKMYLRGLGEREGFTESHSPLIPKLFEDDIQEK